MHAEKQRILDRLAQTERENRRLQALLTDAVSLDEYRALAVSPDGEADWTQALCAALREHEIVRIPAGVYPLSGGVIMPSNRRIEADPQAILRLKPSARLLLMRNERTQDGTHHPVQSGARDGNIAILGGRWEESNEKRMGYGTTGLYDEARSLYGVSTCLFFNCVDHLTLSGLTFRHTAGFAVQLGDATDVLIEDIAFEECFADGLHVNGNTSRLLVRRVRGQVGDDLVALNMYDWQNSSVDFGPMDTVLCEDLELSEDSRYKALRIEPGVYFYADGASVDCSLTHAIIRRVKGVDTFKMYYQTPRYRVGIESPERGGVGSGDWIFFEDIDVSLRGPIDRFPEYLRGDPVRGAYGAFELGANLGHVCFEDVRMTRPEGAPMAFFAVVGPKSVRMGEMEIFDPYVSCRVGVLTFKDVRINGEIPRDLRAEVYCPVFDDVNGDGCSTARGEVGRIEWGESTELAGPGPENL